MNRTVAYQETSNSYDSTDQKIKGTQIATIKSFGLNPPAGAGDFIGQLGVAADAQGNALLYVSSVMGEWKLVGSSGAASLPDTVVLEDRKNNFTEVDQRIEDCSITYVEHGTRKPETMPVKGPGHMYIYETTPVQVYISYDGVNWVGIHSEATGDVELDTPNNFTDPTQQILGQSIVNVRKSSMSPEATGILPEREGELYIQIAEGTPDNKARMWISNNTSAWVWEPLTHINDLPDTVARTDKANDFQAWDQKISGKQILSFIDGGDQTPEQSAAVPDYEGQFYMATHTNIQGDTDIAIWCAKGNKWLPIQQDINLATIARTDKSNRFSQPQQILGEGGPNARWLTGARIKFSGHAPNADFKWRVQNVGEITIYENGGVMPHEYSVWVGVSINPDLSTNTGEWAMVWSSATPGFDKFARLDKSNVFVPNQYIQDGNKQTLISTGHEGGEGYPKGNKNPVAPGDFYQQSFSHPVYGATKNIHLAGKQNDDNSWKRVICADDPDAVLTTQQNNLLTHNQFIGSDTDTKRDRLVGARINHVWGPAPGGIAPTSFGEIIVCEENDPDFPSDPMLDRVAVYFAVGIDRRSWILIGHAARSTLTSVEDSDYHP